MQAKFEMLDLGEMTYFLGLKVIQARYHFHRPQRDQMKILRRYSMEKSKPVSTPIAQSEKLASNENVERVDETSYRSLVGCLLYLIGSRLDIMFVVSLLSIYMHCCNTNHYKARNMSLKKQETVAQSTIEVEYVAATTTCDNLSVVAIAKNPVFHGRTKCFKIKYHFVREVEQAKEVTLVHYSSQDQLADILTKPLGKMKFEKLRYDIRVRNMEAKEECYEMTIHALANLNRTTTSSSNVRAHQSCELTNSVSSSKLRSHQKCELC
ncbi:cysteine-rich receptor-like protein kinase 5 [Gossypium australe]|uniref:Cysteine-rich receptor-like protein kinase 5 n=1 Tax=Gossypium australe TaxID=47621 RepID=A0A5B6VLT4_9ROSI|nr:cysteine-rich receptor-like protein kinase 5 [Gossypium australe]